MISAAPNLSDEVADALAGGGAVVALESAIITHGMPAPRNVETALAVEAAIRAGGAVPATIAVLDGRLHVGMTPEEIAGLAERTDAAKISRADLAVTIATGGTGATTVAATMIAAWRGGVEVFATGGIGGVHRGARESFDVSADLHELATTPVSVVAAGAKAILDLPATLEMLETLGVPVIAVGQDAFPAFWSRDSGLPAPLRIDDPRGIAMAHVMRQDLGLAGGQLVANPVPAEHEIPRTDLEPLIERAVAEARRDGVEGKVLTPYLLSRIHGLTDGRSLETNVALVVHNARLAALIAVEIADLRAAGQGVTP
jgi:pseudouridine-5'-phosphate glycosidase